MKDTEQLYQDRLNRYVTANRNGVPDKVPIRPFAAEVTARHAGFSCQEVTHDYNKAFEAVIRCCTDYDWDAVVPNMVYVWTGLTQAMGLRYYGVPGIDVGPEVGFQYREPPEPDAFMKREEYDSFIENPVRFLYETWLPRVSGEVSADSYRSKLALVKGGMAMLNYFSQWSAQVARMRTECGTPSSIDGMLKAPLDVLADKFRGYMGLASDLVEIPEKVEAACRALMPHLGYIALTSADATKTLPIPVWMHRSCVPLISYEHFNRIFWPTFKPIVEALWAQGNQVLFYAEGNWDAHLDRFAELPDGSIIYHIDRGDPEMVHRVLGKKFCLSGGVPNAMLTQGKPEQVREQCRKLIETLGADGGYVMDASAIIQNDATIENLHAMTDATREFGVYRSPSSPSPKVPPAPSGSVGLPAWVTAPDSPPGVCLSWDQKVKELPLITGDAALIERVWNDIEGLAYIYIWHIVLSF